MASCASALALSRNFGVRQQLQWQEVDILLDPVQGDLLDNDRRQSLLQEIRDGGFNLVVVSPPCNTWSRAVWANKFGPKPVRSRQKPWGLPNLGPRDKQKAEEGNILLLFAFAAMEAALAAKSKGFRVECIMEHPEDLGAAVTGVPASAWQLPVFRSLLQKGCHTVALHQCWFGADYSKHTRLLSTSRDVLALGLAGPPQLDSEFRYVGPLPRT